MRKSPLKHPLAVVRTRIGLGQKEFANLAGCSWRTIQSIELLNLKLSAKLADRISEETGAGFHWLMQGNPDAPIVDDRGLGWRREAYLTRKGGR